ncbi:hypothetical protein I312_104682 [Cryptococcus bacillisporus CA1280]|uniref:uncharacterized protein n=1 Tax=Cryptococcus bacillisporus CA1280 TaxID=1296109 RepID=UPI0033691A5D
MKHLIMASTGHRASGHDLKERGAEKIISESEEKQDNKNTAFQLFTAKSICSPSLRQVLLLSPNRPSL